VRVNYVDPVLLGELADRSRRLKVKRVSERHLVPGCYDACERPTQRAVGSYSQINGVAPAGETSNEIGDVDLATAHLARRANLEDLH
jgi:hypothetical protein